MNKHLKRLEALLAEVLEVEEDLEGENRSEAAVSLVVSGKTFPSYAARQVTHDLLVDGVEAYWDLTLTEERRVFDPERLVGERIRMAVVRVVEQYQERTRQRVPAVAVLAKTERLALGGRK